MIDKLFGNVEAAPILTNWKRQADQSLTGFDANHSGAFPSSPRPLGFGRNSLVTTGQVQFDLRMLKFFKIGEHGKLEVVVESFNPFSTIQMLSL
jgi:hypothetical protein